MYGLLRVLIAEVLFDKLRNGSLTCFLRLLCEVLDVREEHDLFELGRVDQSCESTVERRAHIERREKLLLKSQGVVNHSVEHLSSSIFPFVFRKNFHA